jgi:hypothetical protein
MTSRVLHAYTVPHAAESVRRQQADDIIRKMIKEQPPPNQLSL